METTEDQPAASADQSKVNGASTRPRPSVMASASALADAVTDPTLKALFKERPFVAVLIVASPFDHLEVTRSGINVTYGEPGQEGSIRIAPSVLATLPTPPEGAGP